MLKFFLTFTKVFFIFECGKIFQTTKKQEVYVGSSRRRKSRYILKSVFTEYAIESSCILLKGTFMADRSNGRLKYFCSSIDKDIDMAEFSKFLRAMADILDKQIYKKRST